MDFESFVNKFFVKENGKITLTQDLYFKWMFSEGGRSMIDYEDYKRTNSYGQVYDYGWLLENMYWKYCRKI